MIILGSQEEGLRDIFGSMIHSDEQLKPAQLAAFHQICSLYSSYAISTFPIVPYNIF